MWVITPQSRWDALIGQLITGGWHSRRAAISARTPSGGVGNPGPVTLEQARMNAAGVRRRIPAELWQELKTEGLIRADAPTPGGQT